MSNFYHTLTDYYDEIFPINLGNHGALKFVSALLREYPFRSRILDIGCATGQFAFALSELYPGFHITAIEPDEKMVATAALRFKGKEDKLSILQGGMMDLPRLFPSNKFDSILCIGNTLVHLQSSEEIRLFIDYVRDSLNENGMLILQIVNYSGIRPGEIQELPFIDTPRVSFARHYEYLEHLHKIRFFTRLTLKNNKKNENSIDNVKNPNLNTIYENEISLYPLQYEELNDMCQRAGLKSIEIYGNYNLASSWSVSSPALILTAKK